MEILKGVIWDRGQVTLNGETKYKYVVLGVLITSEKIDGIKSGDNIILGEVPGITDSLSHPEKYESPNSLGDASSALLSVVNFTPDELDRK